MAENTTKPTGASVEEYLASRGDARQQVDARALMALLGRITGSPPTM
jgi:hypothetical protein